MDMDPTILESLGLKEVLDDDTDEVTLIEDDSKSDADHRKDFATARGNLLNLIDNGMTSLTTLGELARQSQSPRAYEVLATLTNTVMSAQKDLMDLHIKKKNIEKQELLVPNYGLLGNPDAPAPMSTDQVSNMLQNYGRTSLQPKDDKVVDEQ